MVSFYKVVVKKSAEDCNKKVLLNINPLQTGVVYLYTPQTSENLKHLLKNISIRMNNIQMQTRVNIFLRQSISPNLKLKPIAMPIIFTRLPKSPLLTHFKPMSLFYPPENVRKL